MGNIVYHTLCHSISYCSESYLTLEIKRISLENFRPLTLRILLVSANTATAVGASGGGICQAFLFVRVADFDKIEKLRKIDFFAISC